MTDPYKITDYRDGTEGRVPCPKCGTLVIHDATRCYACGIHFTRGTAYDFSEQSRARRPRVWMKCVKVAIVVMTIAAVVVAWWWG